MASAGKKRQGNTGAVEKGVTDKANAATTAAVADEEDVESTDEATGGSNLPLISVFDKPTMETARALLEEAAEIQDRTRTDAERLKEIKESLCIIAEANDKPGMRYGRIGLEFHGYKTKRTLSKALLLEHGVEASVIKESYSESKPFISARFVKVV